MRRRSSEERAGGGIVLACLVAVAAAAAVGFFLHPRLTALAAQPEEELAPVSAPPPPSRGALGVSALGRLEPRDGVLRVAGPSSPSANVVKTLRVAEGDTVKAGQLIATLDTASILAATVSELEAELEHARREQERARELRESRAGAESTYDRWSKQVAVFEAKLARARAELSRTRVHSPFAGLVLEVHAFPGERVGQEGILELARVDRMYAIAEVYETDVARVQPGQRALVRSPALPEPLEGEVEWVRPKVQKQDPTGTDPAARKDARVVEVKVRLDDPEAAAPFTHLQVEVEIEP